MYERSFPKEVEVKNQTIKLIEDKFKIKVPPMYKHLVVNYNTTNINLYPKFDKPFNSSSLDFQIYTSEEKYEYFYFEDLSTPLCIYNDLGSFTWAQEALNLHKLLLIGNFGNGFIYVDISDDNLDCIYVHSVQDDKFSPKKIADDILQFIAKFNVVLPLNTAQSERRFLEKYWFNQKIDLFVEIKDQELSIPHEKYFDVDELVDTLYNKILAYVQS